MKQYTAVWKLSKRSCASRTRIYNVLYSKSAIIITNSVVWCHLVSPWPRQCRRLLITATRSRCVYHFFCEFPSPHELHSCHFISLSPPRTWCTRARSFPSSAPSMQNKSVPVWASMAWNVGNATTLRRFLMAGAWSTSTVAKIARSENSLASCWKTGAIALHGLHASLEKSTTIGKLRVGSHQEIT